NIFVRPQSSRNYDQSHLRRASAQTECSRLLSPPPAHHKTLQQRSPAHPQRFSLRCCAAEKLLNDCTTSQFQHTKPRHRRSLPTPPTRALYPLNSEPARSIL